MNEKYFNRGKYNIDMGSDNLILSLAKVLEDKVKEGDVPQSFVCEVSVNDNKGVLKIKTPDGKEKGKIELLVDLLDLGKPFEKAAEEICQIIAKDLNTKYEFKIL